MSDQFPHDAPTWHGSEAGMPAPPGWPAPEPRGPRPTRQRGLALVIAGVLAMTAALGLWAGTTHLGSGHTATTQASAIPASPDAGIVDISTFTRVLGQPTDQLVPVGAGSGMVLTSNGEVLTNNHVVQGAWKIEAQVPGGDTYTATVVGVDPSHDVALLQLTDATNLATITPGNATVAIGDEVAGIGNALGRGGQPAVANGSVTAVDRSITASDPNGSSEQLTGMIQTNANIQPGDSGGALVNADGQVVGMITAGSDHTTSTGGPTTGFAIPIDTALTVVDQIHSGNGSDAVLLGERGYLGVAVRPLDPTTASRLGVSTGALVVGLDTNGPAETAGMTTPAVIRSIDGQPVTTIDTLGPLLHSHVPGDTVSVTWVDASGSHTATVALVAGPAV